MSKSDVATPGASRESGVSFVARFARTTSVAAGFAIFFGIAGAQSATINPTQGLPPGVHLDVGFDDAWWWQSTGRANEAAVQEALEGIGGLFTGLVLTDPLKLDGLSGGQHTNFTYSGEARQAFAIKYGRYWTALLFSEPTTGWTITGLDHEVSQLVGFNGDEFPSSPLPIPLPPAAILFLTGLLGLAFLGRWHSRRLIQSE
jgi:hypothetical protein